MKTAYAGVEFSAVAQRFETSILFPINITRLMQEVFVLSLIIKGEV